MQGRLTKLRWRLSEMLFRLWYGVCPDKNACDYVMRHGTEATKSMLAARRALGERE